MEIINQLATEFHLRKEQVQKTIDLLDDGKTIPFIARYRKEKTGSLDDQLLRQLNDRLQYLRKLQQEKMQQKNRPSTKRVGFSIYKNGITKQFFLNHCN